MSVDKLFLSTNIKHLRTMNGKTQNDLAMLCGKKNTAISNWEKGIRELDALDLAVIADFFNVSIDDLMLKDLRLEKDNKTDWKGVINYGKICKKNLS